MDTNLKITLANFRKAFELKIQNGDVIPYENADGVSFRFNTHDSSITNYFQITTNSAYASYIRVVGKVVFFVCAFDIKKTSATTDEITVGKFENIPDSIFNALVQGVYLDTQNTQAYVDGTYNSVGANTALVKGTDNDVSLKLQTENLVVGTQYHIRHISIFLLSANQLVPVGCTITDLGSSNPTNVVFSKSLDFPTEAEAWEEVDINGNKFAKFTKWYKKVIYSGSELIGFSISKTKEDEDYHLYDCFYDENGNELDYILIGRYCMSSTSVANSVDSARTTMTIGTGRSLARALGTGYQIMDCAMFNFWRDLALAISQNVNFNSGSGVASYLGLARMTEGGWWIDGLTHIDSTYLYCSKPSKYVDNPTANSEGYSALSYSLPTASNYITKLGYDSNHPTINMPSQASGGSASTYYCDYMWYASGNRPCTVNVGDADANYGLFCLNAYYGWTNASGVRLCYKPPVQ